MIFLYLLLAHLVADFLLQLESVKWTAVAAIVNDQFIVSVRNLGYSRNAGDFVRRWFAEIGSAGGHRAMAKAVVPVQAFREKYGDLDAQGIGALMHSFVAQFLRENAKEREGKGPRPDARPDGRTETEEVKAR